MVKRIKLGLIGNSISQSRAPFLHKMLGEIYGVEVSYDLHDPGNSDRVDFESLLWNMRDSGYTGTNVTFPFKQLAVEFVSRPDAAVEEVGATNTLIFAEADIRATNTDYTGFILGYRSRRGSQPAGRTLMLGAGGVGRAVAFGLFEVGATELGIFDINTESSTRLVDALKARGYNAYVVMKADLETQIDAADGLVNCTPIGHYATPGNPVDEALFGSQSWAFDAVYVPIDTDFLRCAHSSGLEIVSGFDLFFYQGIEAFSTFSGIDVDPKIALAQFKQAFDIKSDLFA